MTAAVVEIPAELSATLVLVRHGESVWIAEGRFQGQLDPPLSPLGERQAELVAARLATAGDGAPLPLPDGPPRGIWHSPLRRAADTAHAIGEALPAGVGRYPADGLLEIGQGEWEGLPHAEVRARWAAELAAWRRSPLTDHAPGGESLARAAERVRAVLVAVLGQLPPGVAEPVDADTAAAAASLRYHPVPGFPTGADPQAEPWTILVAHDGILRLTLMSLLGLPLERFWSFPFNLCAISVLAVRGGIAALRAHNLADHLAPLAGEARASAEARGDRRGAL